MPPMRWRPYAAYARDMLHLHQLWCSVEAGNAASLALFRHAGFSETGIRKEWLRLADGFHDEVFLQKNIMTCAG